jgi:hypothetical protein
MLDTSARLVCAEQLGVPERRRPRLRLRGRADHPEHELHPRWRKSSAGFYLLNRSSLGHVQPADTQIVQSFQVTNGGHIHGSPVYWDGPGGPLMYVMGEQDYLKGYRFNGAQFDPTPATMSAFPAGDGMPAAS